MTATKAVGKPGRMSGEAGGAGGAAPGDGGAFRLLFYDPTETRTRRRLSTTSADANRISTSLRLKS